MNAQANPIPATRLGAGEARRLDARGGRLTVVAGRLWLTRRGELGDHVLAAGDRIRLVAADDAVIEAWHPAEGASFRWEPHRGALALLAAAPLRGVAWAARLLALGSAAVARGAARAEGRLGRTAP